MRSYKLIKHKKSSLLGMTLIEVMVALFILSTGILGAVAMQATAKKGSFDAMQRSMASTLTQNIIERMRGNNAALTSPILDLYNGDYGGSPLSAPTNRCNLPTALCTPAQLVANDLFEWEQSLIGADSRFGTIDVGGLNDVTGCINHANRTVTIAISWEGREETADGASDNTLFGQGCGSSTNKRRQIVVNAFIN